MSDRCRHDLSEQDTYVADGYCPLCLLDQIQQQQAEIDELRADAATHDEQLTKVARIRLELESRNIKLEKVLKAAKEYAEWWHDELRGDEAYHTLDEAIAEAEGSDAK